MVSLSMNESLTKWPLLRGRSLGRGAQETELRKAGTTEMSPRGGGKHDTGARTQGHTPRPTSVSPAGGPGACRPALRAMPRS